MPELISAGRASQRRGDKREEPPLRGRCYRGSCFRRGAGVRSTEDAAARPQLGSQTRPELPRPRGSAAASAGVSRSSWEGRGAGAAGVRSNSVGSEGCRRRGGSSASGTRAAPRREPRSLQPPEKDPCCCWQLLGGLRS